MRSDQAAEAEYRVITQPQAKAVIELVTIVLAQAEWWIAIGHQQKCVGSHPQIPATDPDDEVEDAPRVSTGRQNGEPGRDHCKEGGNIEKKQDEDMRDHQQPLDQR